MAYTATIKIPGIGECYGITSSPAGEIYVSRGNSIYKIDLQRRVSLFAGSGGEKSGWRDGRTLEALFNRPSGLLYASNSDLYICDFDNHRIRRIHDGRVSTIAGTGKKGFENHENAMLAKFNHPVQIAEQDGYLFITDLSNKCIRVLDLENNTVTSILYEAESLTVPSGWGAAQRKKEQRKKPNVYGLGTPSGIAFSKTGQLYVTDRWTHSIHEIAISRPVEVKPAETVEELPSQPQNVELESSSSAPLTWSQVVARKTQEEKKENVATNDTSPASVPASVAAPSAPAPSDASSMPVESAPAIPVAEVAPAAPAEPSPADASGPPAEAVPAPAGPKCPWTVDSITRIAGQKQGGYTDSIDMTSAQFRCPTALIVDPNGTLLIADRNNHTIRYMNKVDGVMTEIGVNLDSSQCTVDGHPSDAGTSLPTDLCLLPNGDLAWVEATGALRINTRDCEDTFAAHILADHRIPGFYNMSIVNKYWNKSFGFNEEVLACHPWLSIEVFKKVLIDAQTEREDDLQQFVNLINGAFFAFAEFSTDRLLQASIVSIRLFKLIARLRDEEIGSGDSARVYIAPLLDWMESVFKRTTHMQSSVDLFDILGKYRLDFIEHPQLLALLCATIRSRQSWRLSRAQTPDKRLEDSYIPRSTPEDAKSFELIRAYLSGSALPEMPVPLDYKPAIHYGWTPITRPLRHLIDRKQQEPDWTFTIAGINEEFKAHSWFLYTRWNFFYRLMESGLSEVQDKRTELPSDFPPSILKNVIALVHFRVLNIVEPLDHNDALFVLERGEEFDWKTTEASESVLFSPLYVHAYAALEHALSKHLEPEAEHSYAKALLPIDTGLQEWEAKFDLKKYAPLFPEIELPVLLFQTILAPPKPEEPAADDAASPSVAEPAPAVEVAALHQ